MIHKEDFFLPQCNKNLNISKASKQSNNPTKFSIENCEYSLLADLSKPFDCLSHELLIAKLDAYGFVEASRIS